MKMSEVENYLRFRASNHRPGFLSSDSDFYLRCSRNQERRKWPPQISGLPYILPYIQSDQSEARFHAMEEAQSSILQHWPSSCAPRAALASWMVTHAASNKPRVMYSLDLEPASFHMAAARLKLARHAPTVHEDLALSTSAYGFACTCPLLGASWE